MSIISEVKCARCDRKYSGVRSRCPYCGARRIGSGKYSEEGDNSRGKMIIGILIMSVLVVAAAVLLFSTRPDDSTTISSAPPTGEETESPGLGALDETGNVSVTNNSPNVSDTPDISSEPPSPDPVPIQIQSVTITYAGSPNNDFTANINDRIRLVAKVEPAGVEFDEEIYWRSSNTSVFDVVKQTIEGTSAEVIITGVGDATLTVSVGGVEATCIVRGRR
ncbi:MAG: hypothetical protein FWG88_01205 [Oscillospiraceae bacterium]|nr:hypothetical protein [Oscillospiraceae bacterium]